MGGAADEHYIAVAAGVAAAAAITLIATTGARAADFVANILAILS